MMQIKFSIIVPTYNHAKYLKKAIDSVIKQSYKNWELIIVDNYSDDNTKDIVDSYTDIRIKYYKFKNNGIIAASRNYGIKLSTGTWIAFLDSDDIWYNNKLCVIYDKIIKNSDCHVFCSYENKVFYEKNNKIILKVGPYKEQFYKYMIIHGNKLSTSATVVSKTIINSGLYFNESKQFITVEDYDYWLRIAKNKYKFHFIDVPLGEYLIHKDNLSQNIMKHLNMTKYLLREHVYNIQNFTKYKNILWSFVKARLYLSMIYHLSVQKNYSETIRYSLNLFNQNPIAIFYYILKYIQNKNV